MDYLRLVLSCLVPLHGCLAAGSAPELLLSGKLSEYGVIVPFSTDCRGRFISHVVSGDAAAGIGEAPCPPAPRPSRRRVPRSPLDESLQHRGAGGRLLYFNVTVFGKELHLRLRPNRRLVPLGAVAEWQEDFEVLFREPLQQRCLFTGDISDMPGAAVAISNCDGLAGLIRTDSNEFFIEPLERGQQETEEHGRAHVVYRRSAIRQDGAEPHQDLHPEVPGAHVGDLPNSLELMTERLGDVERKRRHARKDDYNIEVLLAVDDSVVRFHGKEHVQNYVLTLMNIVDEIYHDESLGVHINIVLVRMIMVGYRQSVSLIERGNPSRSLEQVCRWAHSQQRSDPEHAEHHDHAVFLTRQDFGPAGMQGYAPVTGMCHPLRSCTLNHEDGFSSAFVVAHETGHVALGVGGLFAGAQPFERGQGGGPPLLLLLFQWCFKGHCIWKTSEQPYSQDGSWSSWSKFGSCSRTCGGGVRSRSRSCDNPPPAYGGRNCPGATYEYQVCNAEECPGPYQDFRAQQCSKRNSYYTHQNSKHAWLPYEHHDDAQKCELICQSEGTGDIVFMNQVVHDGTRCSYRDPYSICVRGECVHVGCDKEVGSLKQDDKCGVCGGDNSHCRTVKGTLAKTPKQPVGVLKMFEIPAGARHLQIEEMEPASHSITVKNQATGNFILHAKGKEAKTQVFIEMGLEWEYTVEDGKESLKTSGPLHEAISVLVIPQEEEEARSSLMYRYIIHEDLLPMIGNNNVLLEEMDSYEWALKSWSQCSKACGGGIQYTKYGCRRKSDNRMVHRNFCDNGKKPKPIRRRCNLQECSQPAWVAEEWGACSKSCGKLGVQVRGVQCVQRLQNGTTRTLHTKYCPGQRPETRRPCGRLPCPPQWRTGAWSECSASCGEGVRQRQVVCKGSESGGSCEGEKPEAVQGCQVALCPGKLSVVTTSTDASDHSTPKGQRVPQDGAKNPVSKISSREPCLGDKSIFCQMEVLARYCSIPGYNKLCCESCGKKTSSATSLPPATGPNAAPPGTAAPSPTAPLSPHPTGPVQGEPTGDPTLAPQGAAGAGRGQAAR
ncbi:hypothetical protein AV530_016092 [Patagioenas fasciata monilis]|uniref:A disintegrin and metalloproteinase with thrombospondin motifs 14 n=1 Tax=Patagioenas fasciata monilis TaxID=372326 RepID=A0A1V4KJZ1_PATFA|nr:hypothetical protein AV530_016092 [Patagioenas fasciata monilis]